MESTLQTEKNRMHNLLDKVIGTKKPIVRTRKESTEAKDIPIDKIQSPKETTKDEIHNKKIKKASKLLYKKIDIAKKSTNLKSLTSEEKVFKGETPIIAIDCEMVLCADTQKHLARISIVNYNRVVLLDEFVKPELPVKNYLSHITNIDAFKLNHAKSYEEIKPKVESILQGKIIVGHTIENDLGLLGIDIPLKNVRDISVFNFFMNGKYRKSLKELTEEHLGIQIQTGIHSSVEDARATLELYKLYKKEIDREIKDLIFNKSK